MSRCLLAVAVALAAVSTRAVAEPVDYLRDVKPILKERCFACHGALEQKGKLRLDTARSMTLGGRNGPAVTPKNPEESILLQRVTDADDATRMPPEGKPLTPQQIAILREWVRQGALAPANEAPEPDPKDHWAFRAPRRPPLPRHPTANPIDAFLAAEWAKRGLNSSPPADPATLLRRVYLDLIGLPPTREELNAFLANPSPQAYEQVVDRLLASPRYGERWARHWMDVWRYSDWYGRRSVPDVLNSYGQIWRWRDWIVRSLNEDRPYDWMVRMMLAADELAPTEDEHLVATGFLVRNFFRWNYNNWMRDNVEHTAKAFLGLTFNCAHCHDHKYDPITHQEYFAFRAFFEPLEIRHDRWPGEPDPGPYPKYSYGASYKPITSGLVRVFDEKPDAPTFFYTGGDERNKVTDRGPIPPGVPAFLGGKSFTIEPVKLPPTAWYPGLKPFIRAEERQKRTEALAKAREALASVQAAATRTQRVPPPAGGIAGATVTTGPVQQRLQAVAAAAIKAAEGRLAAAQAELEGLEARITAEDAAFRDGSAVPDPVKLAKFPPLSPVYPKVSSGRRAALARWITAPTNPLFARVAVNHVWGWHFGRPLVETTNNFGRSGKPPTHPELLDWLACELMEPTHPPTGGSPGSMKRLHKLIVTSQAYRLGSRSTDAHRSLDPDNLYLARFPAQRMEAEVVRDAVLQAAGQLDSTAFGPETPHEQGLTSRRRSLWFAHHGESRMGFLELFDVANPCDAYRRSSSVLPQQALALTNSELVLKQGRALARTLGGNDEAFIQAAFEQILARPPREAERAASREFLARQAKLFAESKGPLPTSGPEGPSPDPRVRARENLVLALFNHTDFVTIR